MSTAENLTPATDPHWMILLIDKDQNQETGWEGYDLAINYKAEPESESTCAKWVDGKWEVSERLR